jgi:hypothetical protein
VLAVVNEDNDLLALIRDNSVGIGVGHRNLDELVSKVEELIDSQTDQEQQVERCRSLSRALFSADAAAEQVVAGLQS